MLILYMSVKCGVHIFSGSSGSAVDRLLFALTKLIAGSYALMYIKMARLARLLGSGSQ